jgi:NhaP-type Na+/H+ or K+/H+ antiporter
MLGYLSYILAEVIDLSGIMTIFCCGVTMARYAWHNISTESQRGTSLVFTVMAQAAEAFTFTYLGLSVTTLNASDWQPLFMVCMLLAVLLARAASILLSSGLAYCVQRGNFGLGSQYICVTWFSGVLRGAVAFAMSLQITSEHSTVLRTTTMGIVLITTLVLGNLIGPFTRFVGLKAAQPNKVYLELMPAPQSSDKDKAARENSWLNQTWSRLDNTYLKPIFGGEQSAEDRSQKSVWDHLWTDEENEIKS